MNGHRFALALALTAFVCVGAFPMAHASSEGSFSFFAPVPCWWACPSGVGDVPLLTPDVACAPTPFAVPGSYADQPLAIAGDTSTVSLYFQSGAGHFEAFACRMTPGAAGHYAIASRSSRVCGSTAGVCGGLFLPEAATIQFGASDLRGSSIVVRVYNGDAAIETTGYWGQS